MGGMRGRQGTPRPLPTKGMPGSQLGGCRQWEGLCRPRCWPGHLETGTVMLLFCQPFGGYSWTPTVCHCALMYSSDHANRPASSPYEKVQGHEPGDVFIKLGNQTGETVSTIV